MSRSDGRFPRYTKLNLSPKVWPEDYWEESFRCPEYALRWPATEQFGVTPCCNKPCVKSKQKPDFTWPTALIYFLNSRFEKLYEEFNEGKSDEELVWDELRTNNILVMVRSIKRLMNLWTMHRKINLRNRIIDDL